MKTVLRRIYREKRQSLSIEAMEKLTDLMLINFQKIELPYLQYVHTYMASSEQREIDTYIFIRYLSFLNPDLKIVVPKINLQDGSMKHYVLNEDTELILNAFGIPEPAGGEEVGVEKINIVLTPLLVFDERGYRVGYGKGYYDKFFAGCTNDVIKVGLSCFDPIPVINDVNKYDIRLDHCVTPEKVYSFK